MITVVRNYYNLLSDYLLSFISIDISVLGTITDFISGAFMGYIFFILYKYIVLILTAPLMSRLSEDLERHYSDSIVERGNFIKDLLRSLRITVRNVFRELFLSILIFIVSLFPILGWISSPFLFLIQGFYAGFGNYDLWAERHFTYRGTIDFVRDNKVRVSSNGMVFLLMLAIPLLGAIIAPPLATAASTMHALESEDMIKEFV
jgi:CysZ protein